jgi:hypothetical protein
MPTVNDMRWFKQQFQQKINPAVEGTPYTLDFMTALACQESGEIWPVLRKTDLSLDRIVELCVGDTLDGRNVFPRSRAELESVPNGKKMFEIAHAALVDMAQFINGYKKVAKNPNKFCHGYGVFQYDIQFFRNEDPAFFLESRYTDFDACLQKALGELRSKTKKLNLENKPTLTDLELAHVGIAYNTGGFKPALGLKQGHQSDDGKFYGENIFSFIQQARTATLDNEPTTATTTVAPNAARFEVISTDPLRLRREAFKDPNNPEANVRVKLPHGHIVLALASQPVNGFLEVETEFGGETLKGFAAAQFLKRV